MAIKPVIRMLVYKKLSARNLDEYYKYCVGAGVTDAAKAFIYKVHSHISYKPFACVYIMLVKPFIDILVPEMVQRTGSNTMFRCLICNQVFVNEFPESHVTKKHSRTVTQYTDTVYEAFMRFVGDLRRAVCGVNDL